MIRWTTDIAGQVASMLQGSYGIVVKQSSPSSSWWDFLPGLLTNSAPYQWSITVETAQEFTDASDVASLVSNAIYAVFGYYPTTTSVTEINGVSTGEVSQSPISSTTQWVLVAALGIVVVGGFVFYREQIKRALKSIR